MRQLSRYTIAMAAICDVWFVVLWTRSMPGEHDWASPALMLSPQWLVLLGSAAMALGMVAFGVTLNDLLDIRRDRSLHPHRAIAAGKIAAEMGVVLVLLAALTAVLGAVTLGTDAVVVCTLTLVGILIYNGAARFSPALGPLALGLVYASHMMAGNPMLRFLWPVLLVMTHTLIVDALAYRLARRRPLLNAHRLVIAGLGWLFWASVLLAIMWGRQGVLWPQGVDIVAAVPPAALAVGFAVFAWGRYVKPMERTRAAEKLKRYGSVWNGLYAIGWLAGAGHWRDASIIGALVIAGILGMLLLRELIGLREHPVGYRL